MDGTMMKSKFHQCVTKSVLDSTSSNDSPHDPKIRRREKRIERKKQKLMNQLDSAKSWDDAIEVLATRQPSAPPTRKRKTSGKWKKVKNTLTLQ